MLPPPKAHRPRRASRVNRATADQRPNRSPYYRSFDDCVAAESDPTLPSSTPKSSFEKFTWSADLNYQATPDLFFHDVARTSYRAGGARTPVLGPLLKPYQTFARQTVTDFTRRHLASTLR